MHFSLASIASVLSLEAGISRILVVGTAILAILAGFTAVDLPFSYLSSLFRPVSRAEVELKEDRLLRAVDMVRSMNEEAAHDVHPDMNETMKRVRM